MTQIRHRLRLYSFLSAFLPLLLFQTGIFAQKAEENRALNELAGYKYKHRLVNTDKPDASLPMVIGLHWSGSTPDEFERYLDGFTKPVRLILIQGQYPNRAGFSFFPREPKNYYNLPADEKMSVLLQEGEKISRFVEEVTALYKPSKKPFIIGASQGGDLSYVMAIRCGHLISRSFPLLATMDNRIILPLSESAQTRVPIDVFHGTADPIVSLETVKEHVKLLKKNGYKVKLRSYKNIEHDIPAAMEKDYIDLINKSLD